ncbi:MAG: carboxypeptidase-like regulatory domain-containing protein [Pirellulaceae bacterium]
MKRASALFLGMAAVFLLGCGSASPVSAGGTVTYKGAPVANARIGFIPKTVDGAAKGEMASGETDAEGKFTVTTKSPGDGAVPGEYTVTVAPNAAEATENDYSLPPPPPYPGHYSDPGTSSLKVTVKRGDENQFPLEMKD